MKTISVFGLAMLFVAGCTGVSYASRDQRLGVQGNLLTADGAVKVVHAVTFHDMAEAAAVGDKPIFASDGQATVVTNIPAIGGYGGFAYGATPAWQAPYVGQSLLYMQQRSAAQGTLDAAVVGALTQKVGELERTSGRHGAGIRGLNRAIRVAAEEEEGK